jgi:hypothetical protein
MPRTDVYLKVELSHGPDEDAAALAADICRMLRKQYAVRAAEVQSVHARTEDQPKISR